MRRACWDGRVRAIFGAPIRIDDARTTTVKGIDVRFTSIAMAREASRTTTAGVPTTGYASHTVTWPSWDPSVATVDDSGKVTGVGEDIATRSHDASKPRR